MMILSAGQTLGLPAGQATPYTEDQTPPDWRDAIDMTGAQVAVSGYRPAGWPTDTRMLIRRVRLDPAQVSADSRSRRRRTLHPDQRTLPIPELETADEIYSYSFVLTNLDVATPDQTAAVEHWYRRRTTVENVFHDSKIGAALPHLPSGYPQINRAWTWAALIAASVAGWGVRDGKAMIATLRHRLIRIPARLINHAGQLTLRPPPGSRDLLAEVLTRLRTLPTPA